MSATSRRAFLKNAAKGAAAAGFVSVRALELRANPLGMPIGCQTWPVRAMIAQDFPGTIKQLAEAGFQTIELCSPVGYAEQIHRHRAPENSRRCRCQMCEFSLRHRGT
ncbi:MAG: hypothetical protein DMG49_01180 [Acidobacteria bacterium]|nr:MAG: hypothetical protein DMG49_01180 [Acidobacteriota bacterium]